MQVLKLDGQIDADGHLRLDIATHLPPGEVQLAVVIGPETASKTDADRYNFSDLAGTLTWQGDAVAVQRHLRDEW